jgi:hypothetical protein
VVTDVAFSLTALPVSLAVDTAYGIVCRYNAEAQSFYAFLVNGEGQYAVAKMLEGDLQYLVGAEGWVDTGAVAAVGEGSNQLAFVCQGNRLQPWANGQSLPETSDLESSFSQGDVGAVVITFGGSEATAGFFEAQAIEPP